MQKIVKYLLLIGVFYYLLSGLDLGKTYRAFLDYSLVFSILVMVSVILSDYFLSLRWRFLTKKKISLMASFEAIGISAFLNFILPAKTGELSKIVYLKKYYGFRGSNATAILVMERFFDIIFLAFFTLVTALFLTNIDGATAYSLVIIFIIVIFITLLRTRWANKIIRVIPNRKIRHFTFRTLRYVFQISSIGDLLKTSFYSLLVWVSYFLTVYLFLIFVANFNLDTKEIFVVFVISSIAMSIPLLPGGIGTYQAGVVFALGIFGISKEEALIAGVLLQLYNLIPSFLVAIYIIERKNISIKGFKY